MKHLLTLSFFRCNDVCESLLLSKVLGDLTISQGDSYRLASYGFLGDMARNILSGCGQACGQQ
jgi:hypothetical protein